MDYKERQYFFSQMKEQLKRDYENRDMRSIRIALETGNKIRNSRGWIIPWAIDQKDLGFLRCLQKNGLGLGLNVEDGYLALNTAVEVRSLEMVQYLVEEHKIIPTEDAVCYSAQIESYEITEYLLQHGGDLHTSLEVARNRKRLTALDFLTMKEELQLLSLERDTQTVEGTLGSQKSRLRL